MKKIVSLLIMLILGANMLFALSPSELRNLAQNIKTKEDLSRFFELADESVKGAGNLKDASALLDTILQNIEYKDCLAFFKKIAASSDNKDVADYVNFLIGRLYFENGDILKANEYFAKSSRPERDYYAAQELYNKGKYEDALTKLKQIQDVPDEYYKKVEMLKGLCYSGMKQYAEALDIFSKLYLDQDYAEYHSFVLSHIIQIYADLGDREKELSTAAEFLKQYPNSFEAPKIKAKYENVVILQIAALSSEAGAQRLKASLNSDFKYDVTIEKAVKDGRAFFRVRMGPLPANESDTIIRQIKDKYNTKARVVKD